jgi:thioesterase domain-containing protein/acyl carrier protein
MLIAKSPQNRSVEETPLSIGPSSSNERAIVEAVKSVWLATLPSIPFELEKTWSDIGIDSLTAMEFVLRLELELKTRVGFDGMTSKCTASDLVRLLVHNDYTRDAVDARPRVFLIPGVFGDEPKLAHFRKCLSDEVLFETLELPDFGCPARLIWNVAATAAKMIGQVTRVQPEGDILLAGYSYGSLVAQSMACQLAAKGRKVVFLALLDGLLRPRLPRDSETDNFAGAAGSLAIPDAPRGPGRSAAWMAIANVWRWQKSWLKSTIDTWEGWRSFLDRAIFSVLMRVNAWEAARQFLVHAAPRHNLMWTRNRRRLLLLRLRGWAILRWRPTVTEAHALLVASDDFAATSSIEAWQKACPNIRVVRVHSEHEQLFEAAPMTSIVPAFLECLAVARVDGQLI